MAFQPQGAFQPQEAPCGMSQPQTFTMQSPPQSARVRRNRFVSAVKATTVNRLNYNRRKLRVMYKTDKPSYQMWHMDNPSCAEKTDKRSFLFGNHNY